MYTKKSFTPIKVVLQLNVVGNIYEKLYKRSGAVCRQQRSKPSSDLNVLVILIM